MALIDTIPNFNIISQVLSSFFGAFFAFLFVRLGDILLNYYKIKKQNFYANAELEYALNINISSLNHNLQLIDSFIETIQSGKVYFNKFLLLDVNSDYYIKLFDNDLVNKCFNIMEDFKFLNVDFQNINLRYSEIVDFYKQRIIAGQDKIGIDEYNANCSKLEQDLKKIKEYSLKLDVKLKKVLAQVRLSKKNSLPIIDKIIYKILGIFGKKISDEELKREVYIIEGEIKDVKNSSI